MGNSVISGTSQTTTLSRGRTLSCSLTTGAKALGTDIPCHDSAKVAADSTSAGASCFTGQTNGWTSAIDDGDKFSVAVLSGLHLRNEHVRTQDLVIPVVKIPHDLEDSPLWAAAAHPRRRLLFFRGDVGALASLPASPSTSGIAHRRCCFLHKEPVLSQGFQSWRHRMLLPPDLVPRASNTHGSAIRSSQITMCSRFRSLIHKGWFLQGRRGCRGTAGVSGRRCTRRQQKDIGSAALP